MADIQVVGRGDTAFVPRSVDLPYPHRIAANQGLSAARLLDMEAKSGVLPDATQQARFYGRDIGSKEMESHPGR